MCVSLPLESFLLSKSGLSCNVVVIVSVCCDVFHGEGHELC